MIKVLKPLSFIPALLLMYIIYSFSAQDGATSAQLSYEVSYKVIEVGGDVLGADFQDWEIDQLANRFQTPVRKLAHMTEYFALAVAVAFPLYVYGLRGILLLFFAGLICVGFACGDEYHQAHVAGRGPSVRDVLIDSFGVFWGIILVRIIGWTGRKTIFRPFSKKNRRDADTRAEYPEEAGRFRQPLPEYYGPAKQRFPQQRGEGYYRQGEPGYPYQPAPYYYGQSQPAPDSRRRQAPGFQDGRGNSYPTASAYDYMPQENYDRYDYEDEDTTSDRLSEDMSFRKLVSDLKEQKQARRSASRTGSPQAKS